MTYYISYGYVCMFPMDSKTAGSISVNFLGNLQTDLAGDPTNNPVSIESKSNHYMSVFD